MMPTKSSSKLHKKKAIKHLNFLINLAMVAKNTKQRIEEPQTLHKAWNHPNEDSCKKWQEAIHKEFVNIK